MTVNSTEKIVTSAQATMGKRVRNFLIAMVAIALCVALVLGLRTETGSVSLANLDEMSIPLEIAVQQW